MKLKTGLKNLWNDESAQGATEYILLLVIVVALALTFKDRIMGMVKGKLSEIEGGMGQLKPEGGG